MKSGARNAMLIGVIDVIEVIDVMERSRWNLSYKQTLKVAYGFGAHGGGGLSQCLI